MKYESTRGNHELVDSSEAIRQGMVPQGGLFVPVSIPKIDLASLVGLDYCALATKVIGEFLTDFSKEELAEVIGKAYQSSHFDNEKVVPLKMINDKVGILELFHGPTAAFKDLALQLLPHLLTLSIQKQQLKEEVVILVATSGDTGKAALEGFKDVKGTRIIVFYPKDGVSLMQERQMVTTAGSNTAVIGVEGNFDDCQNMVKDIFGDEDFSSQLSESGFELSSANSINWGRLVPQIVYYFHAYNQMVENGSIAFKDEINVTVPTGNFGNILAAYYAKRMGLPIKTLICASNRNNVLTDFFKTGRYNRKREFHKTSSPSMDILISSNLERFLFHLLGDAEVVKLYDGLSEKGEFSIDDAVISQINKIIESGYADEDEVKDEIRTMLQRDNYLMDPHTAVAMRVYKKYCEKTGDTTPTVVDSTASPYKFVKSVYDAISGVNSDHDDFRLIGELKEISGVDIHPALKSVASLEIKHDSNIKIAEGRQMIKTVLQID